MYMVLIASPNKKMLHKIARMHWEAYHSKYPELLVSHNMDDYLFSTLEDCQLRKCLVLEDLTGLIVLEDMTDKLLLNSTYHLVRRIYVVPSERNKGKAKQMVRHCQKRFGTLMGYNGKFYTIGEIK